MAPETAVQRSRDVLLAVPAIPEVETLRSKASPLRG